DGGVGGSHHRRHRRRPHHDAEHLVPDLARSQLKDGSRRIGLIQGQPCRHHPQGGQEQDVAHQGRDQNARYGASVHLGQGLDSLHPGIQQAVAPRKGDVPADRTPDQGHDRHEKARPVFGRHLGDEGTDHRFPHRRGRGEHDIQGEADHDKSQHQRKTVHRLPGFLRQEEADGDQRADDRPDLGINAEQHVEAEAGSSDVSDIEGQPAQHHQKRQEIAEPRQHLVGDVLGPAFGYGDDAPDVQLGTDVQENGGQNDKPKTGRKLRREYGGLGQKARTDRRGGHQEGRSQQQTPVEPLFHDAFTLSTRVNCPELPNSFQPFSDARRNRRNSAFATIQYFIDKNFNKFTYILLKKGASDLFLRRRPFLYIIEYLHAGYTRGAEHDFLRTSRPPKQKRTGQRGPGVPLPSISAPRPFPRPVQT